MKVERISPEAWADFAEAAHLIAFKETRSASHNTFDYALVVLDEREIFAYATVIEMDKDTAYMQHGGAMPNIKGTTRSRKAYAFLMNYLRTHYRRISTRIEAENIAMLKFAFAEGLRINGCDLYQRETYCHLSWGFV